MKWSRLESSPMPLDRQRPRCRRHWKGSRFALAVLPLTFILEGCGTFAALVEAPPPIVKSNYLNPPRPNPIIPPKVEFGPLQYWSQKKVAAGKLLCVRSNDYVSLRVFNKEISFWMKQANAALDYHETQNIPPPSPANGK